MTLLHAVLSFALVAGLLMIIPGLDTTLVLRTATMQGRKQAFATALGITMGILVWGSRSGHRRVGPPERFNRCLHGRAHRRRCVYGVGRSQPPACRPARPWQRAGPHTVGCHGADGRHLACVEPGPDDELAQPESRRFLRGRASSVHPRR